MTYLIALTRWRDDRPLDEDLPMLARAMGLAAYDARLRLATPLPLVIAGDLQLAEAQAIMLDLRERGHGAIACESARVPSPDDAFHVREFEVRQAGVALADTRRRTFELPYPEFLGLIRAAEVRNEVEMLETTQNKFSFGRAALSGGLMRRKEVKSVETHNSNERQNVLYLFRTTVPEPVVWKERELNYFGLAEYRGSTHHQNFATLVDWLRRCAPHAVFDERLMTAKRRPNLATVEGGAGKRVETSTNSAANLVAAYLLMHAYVQGQI